MTDYNSMSVEDLFEVYGHMHGNGVLDAEYPFQQYGKMWAKKLGELQAIIRRAVIREESVGYVVYHETYYGGNLTYDGLRQKLVGEAKYDLIPKENP